MVASTSGSQEAESTTGTKKAQKWVSGTF